MADTARGQVIGSLREIADYVVEHEDTATAANALRTAADEIERLRESAKSDKADSTPIRVGSGSTTPKEREEQHACEQGLGGTASSTSGNARTRPGAVPESAQVDPLDPARKRSAAQDRGHPFVATGTAPGTPAPSAASTSLTAGELAARLAEFPPDTTVYVSVVGASAARPKRVRWGNAYNPKGNFVTVDNG